MAEWVTIAEFPRYAISDEGEVRNVLTDRIMAQSTNQAGIVFVGLVHHGVQYQRAVAKLMAEAFVDPINEHHDTPIHLNGNRNDMRRENLMYRPRWFAIRFMQQFDGRDHTSIELPIRDVESKQEFEGSWHASQCCGLIEYEIVMSILNGTLCWPTYQRFEMAEVIRD